MPRARTDSISALEAQSKPVPNAAKRDRILGSGLHLTARTSVRIHLECIVITDAYHNGV